MKCGCTVSSLETSDDGDEEDDEGTLEKWQTAIRPSERSDYVESDGDPPALSFLGHIWMSVLSHLMAHGYRHSTPL